PLSLAPTLVFEVQLVSRTLEYRRIRKCLAHFLSTMSIIAASSTAGRAVEWRLVRSVPLPNPSIYEFNLVDQ
ncbi:MAG TPA: hypothetical protein VF434_03360, partial [Promineifilum sp.]